MAEGIQITQNNDLYQAIFNNCQFGLIVLSEEQKIVDWNPWVAKFSGLSREEVRGKQLQEIFPGIMDSSLGRAIKVAISHGMSSIISHTLNPNILPLYAFGGALLDQQLKVKPLGLDKHCRSCLIQINDITASVKRDKQLLENVEELSYQQHVLDQHAIVAVTDVKGRITYVNDLFCTISQYNREELLGNNHRLINSGIHSKEFFREMFQTISKGKVWKGEICNRAKNGDLYWVSTTIVPDLDKNGKPKRYFAIRSDITELKHAEEAAKAAAIAKAQFLANMSHEIRTPMNAILGLTRQVMETKLTQDQRDQLNKVKKSSQALVSIINDILDFSRFESGYVALERVPVQLESVLLDVSNLFGAQIDEKGLELFVDIDPNTPFYIMGDALRLTQILNNLIGNAVKFTDRGEIYLSVHPVDREDETITLRFSILDTGIGILPEQLKLLFNPFVQADSSTTRKFGGSGLGLAIVKNLVEMMGGEIEIVSTFGHGTAVSFTIKVGIAPNEQQIPYKLHQDLQRLRGKRVLIVDDQETARQILSRLLTAWGMQAIAVQSGHEALTLIAEAEREGQPFYAVLLDWRMPGMNGLEVASAIKTQIKKDNTGPALYVLMVTAYEKQALLIQTEAEYIDGLLTKPIVPSALFDALLRKQARSVEETNELISRNFNGLRVLLVEDHDLNQEVAANFLKKRGVDVKIAWNGAEAVEIVKQQKFDLVLMDLHMPVMGGLEATQLIRELPQGKNLPIVAMTAAVLEEDRVNCIDAGMNDFISKPVEPEELMRVIGKHFAGLDENKPDQPKMPAEKSVLDLALGLTRLDGDKILQQRLLISFSERYHDVAERFQALIAEQNTTEAAELIHGLKGVAANLGAMALPEACRRLLEEMKTGNVMSHAHFEATLIETLRQIQQYIIKYTPPDTSNEIRESIPIPDILQTLEPFITSKEVIPDNLLTSLRQLAESDLPSSPHLRQLLHHIGNFEHREANEVLEILRSSYGKS